jgi:hypothetical protein
MTQGAEGNEVFGDEVSGTVYESPVAVDLAAGDAQLLTAA